MIFGETIGLDKTATNKECKHCLCYFLMKLLGLQDPASQDNRIWPLVRTFDLRLIVKPGYAAASALPNRTFRNEKAEAARAVFPPGTPYFIQTSSADVRGKFDEIWLNNTIGVNEKFKRMKALAQRELNFLQLSDFNFWLDAVRERIVRTEQRLGKLSKEARSKFNEIKALRLKEEKIIRNLDPKIAYELSELI
ncbi:unnamed protein product [Gongylonema pulchrum]|uniref:Uncharacterized protein n=1 Tax=Gongylonema pulchrum TaxID=637853 RepID=A0A183CWX1_9BILA|nr:unnamed protein product [Gongylonema pulchrum]